MKEKLLKLKEEALAKITDAAQPDSLEAARVEYLGKKGELTQILRGMGEVAPEDRPAMGQMVNAVREAVEAAIELRRRELSAKALEAKLGKEKVDVTIPGEPVITGRRHPLNIAV
ncbi:MAG: phenylalanine--tRNA ligase subunit alpha, partial [Clostridia bacterium]|nr:phenylalanine--tRNA ligase subunit alpha [Clostridia bacterium]